jgi:hypothetical protein
MLPPCHQGNQVSGVLSFCQRENTPSRAHLEILWSKLLRISDSKGRNLKHDSLAYLTASCEECALPNSNSVLLMISSWAISLRPTNSAE